MVERVRTRRGRVNESDALKTILEGTAAETGDAFFRALVRSVAEALNVAGAWVTEFPDGRQDRLRSLAFWLNGQYIDEYEYDIAGTPCEPVIHDACLIHIPENVIELFPGDPELPELNAVSYMGVPLQDTDGTVLGNLAVLDTAPLPPEPRCITLFRIFAARAAAEHRRLRAEAEVREREARLSQLVKSALDGIIELDESLRIVGMNPAAAGIFQCGENGFAGEPFGEYLSEQGRSALERAVRELEAQRHRATWLPREFEARRAGGEPFPAEATLARYQLDGQSFYTLILRDISAKLAAEKAIRALEEEAEYLKEELTEVGNFEEIIGESQTIKQVLRDIQLVAKTDATVLISGESGTGKELVARAVHNRSDRRDKPFVKVNCAAVPANLIESEFFGHEQGAFTGATKRREGRFALARGGTIFLDEIAELQRDLQAKLLRVLQEGEFEPVGSSKTQKVDVRVIAATNRDLLEAVRDGEFREDLYYRLNVFPIEIPPLRERGDDVSQLARAFVEKFSQRFGQRMAPLSPASFERLKRYDWPGNVRELQNVIERAVITAVNGRLNLERALPETTCNQEAASAAASEDPGLIKTDAEFRRLERENIERALEAADGRVSGENGAARLLGLNPSTLASRMKALGIERPRQAQARR